MISIRNLTKYYDDFLAVKDLSLDIPEGQVLGLLGPNGAGKSTTLRILTGYLSPSAGTIFVDGHDVSKEPQKAQSVIGYLPESSPVYPDMMVFDYLDYIAEVRGIPKDKKMGRLKELARLCGISDVMHKTVSSLSKGYKQRVGLAHAMMSDPKILILDEPTSGLDPNQIKEIRSIIKEIGRQKTVIFSTHILSEAEATCDRIVIVNQGQIAADGTMDELKKSPGKDFAMTLSLRDAQKSDVQKILSEVEGVNAVTTHKEDNLINVTLEASHDVRAEVYLTIKNRDWILLEMHQTLRSLENVFSSLTNQEAKIESK